MRTWSWLICVLILGLCGCGTVITTRTDPISGASITEYNSSLPLTYEGEGAGEVLSFLSSQNYQNDEFSINIRLIKSGNSVDARTILEFRGEDWMFIEGVTFLFSDGTSITGECNDPYRDVIRGAGVFERLSFPTDMMALRALCEGHVTLIRLSGDHLYQDCTIPEGTQSRLQAIWDDLTQKHPELLDTPVIETTQATGRLVDDID